jgi:hypothetical protein
MMVRSFGTMPTTNPLLYFVFNTLLSIKFDVYPDNSVSLHWYFILMTQTCWPLNKSKLQVSCHFSKKKQPKYIILSFDHYKCFVLILLAKCKKWLRDLSLLWSRLSIFSSLYPLTYSYKMQCYIIKINTFRRSRYSLGNRVGLMVDIFSGRRLRKPTLLSHDNLTLGIFKWSFWHFLCYLYLSY